MPGTTSGATRSTSSTACCAQQYLDSDALLRCEQARGAEHALAALEEQRQRICAIAVRRKDAV